MAIADAVCESATESDWQSGLARSQGVHDDQRQERDYCRRRNRERKPSHCAALAARSAAKRWSMAAMVSGPNCLARTIPVASTK